MTQETTSPPLPHVIQTTSFLSHFQTMMGPHGLYQHATIRTPLLKEGYCTDDNARAVQMLVRLLPQVTGSDKPIVKKLLARCWQFLQDAEESPGKYYNFRTAAGQWLPQDRSDDMYARLISAAVAILTIEEAVDFHASADTMLQSILNRANELEAPRFWTEVVVALATLPSPLSKKYAATTLIKNGITRLATLWRNCATTAWPWFEPKMTYANALFPYSFLAARQVLSSAEYETILHASATFLTATTIEKGMFIPIGSNGWYDKGGTPSRDNQQPIEAGTTLDFLLAYYRAFPERITPTEIIAPYLWFFGKNTNAIVLVDITSGACLDGIFPHGPNPNCGAESMLAYLWAEVRLAEAPPEIRDYAYAERAKLLREKAA